MRRAKNKNRNRGAALVEAAFVVPVLLLIILGGWDILTMLYNRAVVQNALYEGLQLARNSAALQTDLSRLNTSLPVEEQLYQNYKAARAAAIQGAMNVLGSARFSDIEFAPVRHLDPVGWSASPGTGKLGSASTIAFLPPGAGAVGENKTIYNTKRCYSFGSSLDSLVNGATSVALSSANVCGGGVDPLTTSYSSMLGTIPTEMAASIKVKTLLFGTQEMLVRSAAFLIPSNGAAPVANPAPPASTTESDGISAWSEYTFDPVTTAYGASASTPEAHVTMAIGKVRRREDKTWEARLVLYPSQRHALPTWDSGWTPLASARWRRYDNYDEYKFELRSESKFPVMHGSLISSGPQASYKRTIDGPRTLPPQEDPHSGLRVGKF